MLDEPGQPGNSAALAALCGGIDCDTHPALVTTRDLLPWLDSYWREQLELRDIDRLELTAYPPAAPISGRADWREPGRKPGSSLQRFRADLLDRYKLGAAICNVLYGAQVVYNEHMGHAFCGAINDWLAENWLAAEPRLRGSVVVSAVNPQLAAQEIRKRADDGRFVQVHLLAAGDMPLGRQFYWPIYRAAAESGFPVAIHAGGMYRRAPTQAGYPSTLVEDYVLRTQDFATQLLSLLAEGVFLEFPDLKFVLSESGVTWLPSFLWRLNKDWVGVRVEVPWLSRPPSTLIRANLRLTLQPFDLPDDAIMAARLCEQLDSDEMLLFSSDYPHWQFDGDAVVPSGFGPEQVRRIAHDNPRATYPRLEMAR